MTRFGLGLLLLAGLALASIPAAKWVRAQEEKAAPISATIKARVCRADLGLLLNGEVEAISFTMPAKELVELIDSAETVKVRVEVKECAMEGLGGEPAMRVGRR